MPRRKPPEQIPLDEAFYARPATEVARDLLGRWMIRDSEAGLAAGRIVEVEAYLGADDPASHAYRGRSKRNGAMFGPPGRAYVYTIHTRFCMNAVTGEAGVASAVLIRALEPVLGIEQMESRRRNARLLDLARGPGRLCEALAVDRAWDGWNLTLGRELWIAQGSPIDPDEIFISPRIGISKAQDWPLRFVIRGNRYVSGVKRLRE
jgi:DNA-3-methyladenine glycosylase